MTVSREQVADLQPGDVVRVTIEGPLKQWGGELRLPTHQVLAWDVTGGREVAPWVAEHELTVVSRAPRPLYVNHPRTEPAAGDVVREDGNNSSAVWFFTTDKGWIDWDGDDWSMPRPVRLRLLVDGETGQVVR